MPNGAWSASGDPFIPEYFGIFRNLSYPLGHLWTSVISSHISNINSFTVFSFLTSLDFSFLFRFHQFSLFILPFTDHPLSLTVAVYSRPSIVLHYIYLLHAFSVPPFLCPCSLLFPPSLFHVIFLWSLQPVTSHALLYRLSPVFTPHSHSIPFLSAVHSPTHPLLSLLFSPCLSFPLWRHWTKSWHRELHPLHSQHPLCSSPSSSCCFIWSHWYPQSWPFLSHWK